MKVDCHSHTKYSFDAFCRPKGWIRAAKKSWMDAIAVTDHNTAKSWPELKQLSKQFDFPVIFGEEIKTTSGDIIGLFLNKEIKKGSPLEVIDKIREQDGVVIIPHPFDKYRGFENPETVARRVDAIEVFNSRVLKKEENSQALGFAKKYGLGLSAGSDAHACFEIGRAYAVSKGGTLEDFRKDLKKGKTKVSGRLSSPLVHLISTVAKTGIRA